MEHVSLLDYTEGDFVCSRTPTNDYLKITL